MTREPETIRKEMAGTEDPEKLAELTSELYEALDDVQMDIAEAGWACIEGGEA